jgi:hypothetical protein
MKQLTSKHHAAIASILFMAHVLPIMVERGMIEIEKADAAFVASYIRLGKWLVYGCASGCGLWIISGLHGSLGWIERIAQLIFIVLIIAILLSIIVIMHDQRVLHDDNSIDRVGIKSII